MNDLKLKSAKKERKNFVNQNPFESLIEIGQGVKKSLVDDLTKDGIYEAEGQILKPTELHQRKHGGDLSAGQEIDFSTHVEAKTETVTAMGREFAAEIVHASTKADKEISHELQVKYNEILLELKALGESSKELKAEVEVLTVEQTTEDIGVYHVSFVEGLLIKLREIRESVDDGLAWFKALRSKSSAKGYRSMAKKAGTSFTLSNERTASTQSG